MRGCNQLEGLWSSGVLEPGWSCGVSSPPGAAVRGSAPLCLGGGDDDDDSRHSLVHGGELRVSSC